MIVKALSDNIGAETRDNMAGLGIALPEPLHGEDAKLWFKRLEVCAAANEWDGAKNYSEFPHC